jgi:glycosyltransferase involved in cell wall biosynthesis
VRDGGMLDGGPLDRGALDGGSIICFAQDWGGDPTSKMHIMRILARKNRVLWVNSIGMRRPTASGADLRRIVAKLKRSIGGCVEVEPNVFVANPLVLPLPGIALFDRLNAEVLVAWLRRLCRRLRIEGPVLYTFLPYMNRLVGRLGERMVVYHCVDEYAAFTGVPRVALMRMEQDLVRRADVVLASAENLCEERRPLNPNTHFVPHGVDVAHFARALDPATPVPEDLARLPRPVVGFVGLLADWVDFDVIRALALARPAWSFALVGKASTDLGPLRGVANIHLLGQKPYAAVPGYLRGFDVGLIPFRVNELTVRANPLKLREYLAAGLPVVSASLPEVARYDGLVRLAGGVPGFLAQIEAALAERSAPMVRRRLEAMRAEGWEARVEEISAIVRAGAGSVA